MHRSAVSLIHLLPASALEPADAHLLRAFATTRSDGTFEELVRRHGPMVLATCRRALGNVTDAEDAFQAVFLVLARKASAVRGNLAGWLYAVSVRTARGVRIMRERRHKHETAAPARCESVVPPETDHDLAAVIDEELARLPEYYREAIVLCELRGLSRKQAADELGLPEGTLSSRLAAAKRKLAALLSARGLAPTALGALLAPASVSAALVESAVSAVRGTVGPVAGAAASAVVRAMLFDQLRSATLAAGILLTVVCGGLAMTGAPGGADPIRPTAPAPRPAEVPAAKLVEQLGADAFEDRETAAKQLRALGARAKPALGAALRSDDPEIRQRAAKILAEIRGDLLQTLVKEFDPAKDDQPDHPLWHRFRTLTGDTRAARNLFAGIIKNPNWLRRLDTAEANPAEAVRQYQEAAAEVGKQFEFNNSVSFHIPVWPCDRGEEVAYLMFLGSYPDTASTPPKIDPARRHFGAGESRIHFGHGLELGLQGKMLKNTVWHAELTTATPGTDRVFSRLLAAWLGRRELTADVVPNSLWLAARYGASDVLPLARTIAADKFPRDRKPAPQLYAAALAVVARCGAWEDRPLFERYFGDEAVLVAFELEGPHPAGTKIDGKGATQLRDAATALALVFHGEDPAKYGFLIAGRRWTQVYARMVVDKWDPCAFGFLNGDDKARPAAHAKVKAFLAEQPKVEPKPVGQLHKFEGHTGLVGGVAFVPGGDRIVTSGHDATYRLWNAKTGKELDQRSTGQKESQVGGPVAVSPDGKRIAARYFVAEADTGKFLFGLEGHTGRITRITYSADGKRILTASHDGTVRMWDADGKELLRLDAHMGQKVAVYSSGLQPREDRYINRGAWDAAFSSDGKRIVSGGADGTVRVWDTGTAKELQSTKVDRTTVMAVAFLPDDKRIVSAGSDGVIRIWDAATGKELKKLEGHTGTVAALAVTHDGKRIVSAGHDKTVRVWDIDKGTELRCFRGHTAAVQAVAVSPDGKTALSGGEDNTARLWALPVE